MKKVKQEKIDSTETPTEISIANFKALVLEYGNSPSKNQFIKDVVEMLGEAVDPQLYGGNSKRWGNVLGGIANELIYKDKKN